MEIDEKPFHCDQCQFRTARFGNLVQHKQTHTDDKRYHCDECGYRTYRRNILRRHKLVHTRDKRLKCPHCSFCSNYTENLKNHLKAKHPGKGGVFMCPFCSFSTLNITKFLQHFRNHAQRGLMNNFNIEKEKRYSCQYCEFATNRKAYLLRHVKKHEKETLQCPQCNYVAKTKEHILIHKYESHEQFKPFQCDFCEYRTTTFIRLTEHSYLHTGEKPFHCDSCAYKASNVYRLKQHKLRHTGERPFKCNQCEYSARQQSNLKVHQLLHSTGEQYKCAYCDYSTIWMTNFMYHLKSKHPDKGGVFSCHTCPYSTIIESRFQNHLQLHKEGTVVQKAKKTVPHFVNNAVRSSAVSIPNTSLLKINNELSQEPYLSSNATHVLSWNTKSFTDNTEINDVINLHFQSLVDTEIEEVEIVHEVFEQGIM